jgi:hypothetical protein
VEAYRLTIPMAFQLVIEDVGWWEKSYPAASNSPFRSGLPRRHHPSDYLALARLGQRLNMRPLIAFVACEWDRSNLLRKIPSATWMGSNWDNRRNVGPWLDQAADILRTNQAHLEIGLHAVGHEYWINGRRSRTEFHDTRGGMRPRDHIRRHLDAFGDILAQNGLGPFPQAFVPPGLNHSFGDGECGFQRILNQYGVRFVTTDLTKAKMHRPRQHPLMAWEEEVLLIERGAAPMPWHVCAAAPQFTFDRPILSLHWANLIHGDVRRNMDVIDRWAAFLKAGLDPLEHMLSPDTATGWSQFVYRTLGRIRRVGDKFKIDIRDVRKVLPKSIKKQFYLKIQTPLPVDWQIQGGRIQALETSNESIQFFCLKPDEGVDTIVLSPGTFHERGQPGGG